MSKHILQYQPTILLTFFLSSWSRICYLPVFVIVYIFAVGCDQTLSSTFCTLLINLRSCGKKQKSCSPFIILVRFLTVLRKGQLQLQICAQDTKFSGYSFCIICIFSKGSCQKQLSRSFLLMGYHQPPHIGPKSLILAPQDIPDISGYQLEFGCQCVKAYSNENPVRNQKIL